MRLGLVLALLLTAGCRQIFGVEPPGPLVDATPQLDAPDAMQGDGSPPAMPCFADDEVHLAACLSSVPLVPVQLGDAEIDTDTDVRCAVLASATPDLCVIAGSNIDVKGQIIATGARPLVLWALDTLDIEGTIDVSSHGAIITRTGAGASTSCIGTVAPTMRGGGAGGTFGSKGGAGGRDPNQGASHGGMPASITPITQFRGGCPGDQGDAVTRAGAGGGAVALVATTLTMVAGVVNASGGGGNGAAANLHGGGGGGAGGMIDVIAMGGTIDAQSQLFANGGGGGGGSTSGAAGSAGGDPLSALTAGAGGDSPVARGGSGYPSVQNGQDGGSLVSICAGGGGGGGAGVVRISSMVTSHGMVSPSPGVDN